MLSLVPLKASDMTLNTHRIVRMNAMNREPKAIDPSEVVQALVKAEVTHDLLTCSEYQ